MKKFSFFIALFAAIFAMTSCEQRSLKDLIVYEEEDNGGNGNGGNGDNTTPST